MQDTRLDYTVHTEAFEGPLDLLLQLVEAEKLDLNEISLVHVIEPFVAIIRERAQDERYPLEDLAHFLVIAAKLVALKSRLMVPSVVEEDEEGVSLVERLRAYQAFVHAGTWLGARSSGGALMFSRGPHEESLEGVLPVVPSLERLKDLFRAVLRRREIPPPPPRQAIMQRLVTLEDRMETLRELIRHQKTLTFARWIGPEADREMAVVSFLALLELLKSGALTVSQPDLFADLTISSV
ncbi:segregation/condensation protein A [Patescibacteria group bacterium]|nr:segregation/condensation protein A [Patescibacteria group bacterium]